ncbi:MAG: hypothetical protein ISS70_13860 [Phycisphaerae bacterium]|nr:hypothetical protein [Phycisphaerae bacterium]
MACRPISHHEYKAESIPDIWECRYFVSGSKERPDGYEHDDLKDSGEFFHRWDGPRRDDDVYFISDEIFVNVKLRESKESEPTIKLRVCLDAYKGFQLWHTEFVERLPAPAEVWKQVLEQLKIKIGDDNEKQLSTSSQASEVERILCRAVPKPLCKQAVKLRWRYIGPLGEVEVAEVAVASIPPRSEDIASPPLYSVSFESKSTDTTGIRKIRDALKADRLGTPESYVQWLTHWPK